MVQISYCPHCRAENVEVSRPIELKQQRVIAGGCSNCGYGVIVNVPHNWEVNQTLDTGGDFDVEQPSRLERYRERKRQRNAGNAAERLDEDNSL